MFLTLHLQDPLRQEVTAGVQPPDNRSSGISHELEPGRPLSDVPGTDDLIVVHDAGPHTAVTDLVQVSPGPELPGPESVPSGGVQGHHGGDHHTGALLPQPDPGIQDPRPLDTALLGQDY